MIHPSQLQKEPEPDPVTRDDIMNLARLFGLLAMGVALSPFIVAALP